MPPNGRKVFRASAAPPPLEFSIVMTKADVDVEYEFSAHGRVSAGAVLALAEMGEALTPAAVMDAFALLLGTDEFGRFRSVIMDPESTIDLAGLAEILQWLISEATGRPTAPPFSSEDGRPTTSTFSTGSSSPADVTSSPSLQPAF